jgi:phage shock protein PspC (stress-responsive transcriptional regulator)
MMKELSEFWQLNEENKKADLRRTEAEELVRYNEQLIAEDKKRQSKTQAVFIGLGAVLSFIAMLSIFMASGSYGNFTVLLGVVLLILAGFYTLNQISYDPLRDLSRKIDQLQQKWLKDNQRKTRKKSVVPRNLLLEKRSSRVFLGVASRISDKLGLEVGLVRLTFVILFFMSAGAFVPFYIVLGIVFNVIEKIDRQANKYLD